MKFLASLLWEEKFYNEKLKLLARRNRITGRCHRMAFGVWWPVDPNLDFPKR